VLFLKFARGLAIPSRLCGTRATCKPRGLRNVVKDDQKRSRARDEFVQGEGQCPGSGKSLFCFCVTLHIGAGLLVAGKRH
jgi:hypothetical protein